MADSVILSLGLRPGNFDSAMQASLAKIEAFEQKWKNMGRSSGGITRDMLKEHAQYAAALDRLGEIQRRSQLERMAGFQPEIIVQREILQLRQRIAGIEGETTQKIELQIQLEQKLLELERMIAREAERAAAAKEAGAAASARDSGRSAGGGVAAADKPGEVERALQRKLGLNDALKGLLMGVGAGSVQAIADALVSPFKKSADSAEKIAEYTERSVVATRTLLDLRLTDALKIQQLEKESARMLREAEKPPELSAWRQGIASILTQYGLIGAGVKAISQEQEVAGQRAEAAAKVEENAVEIARLKAAELAKAAALAETRRVDALAELSTGQKVTALQRDLNRLLDEYVAKQNDKVAQEKVHIQLGEREREIKAAIRDYQQETNLSAQEQIERARLHLTSLARPLNIAEGTRLEIMKLQSRELVIQSELAPLLKKGIENLTPEERKRFEELVHQNDLLDKQIEKKQKIIDATKQHATEEKKVGDAIQSNIKAWESFQLLMTASGRGDKDLTDRELDRKRRTIEQDIFQRRLAADSSPARAGGFTGYDPLLNQQRMTLQQLLGEISFRRDVRQTVSTRGEEAALNQYGGLSEQRLREITGAQTMGQAAVDELKSLNNQFKRGIQVVIPPGL